MPQNILVFTKSSSYILDMENMTATRQARHDVTDDLAPSKLRKDDEKIKLVTVRKLAIGEPMILILGIRDDGVLTERITTEVQNIIYS